MNQQLRIIIQPDQSTNSLEELTLEAQFKDGYPLAITDADLWVFDQAGDVIVTDLAPTITDNSVAHVWTAGEIATLIESSKANYRAHWVLNSGERRLDRWFNVVWWKLLNQADDLDILSEIPDLNFHRSQRNLVASDNGTTTTLICNQLTEPDGFHNGAIIKFETGSNFGREVRVKSWTLETKTLELQETVAYASALNERFTLKASFQPHLDSTWTELIHLVQSWIPTAFSTRGLTLTVDSLDFRQVHLYRTIAKICKQKSMKAGDAFDNWFAYYTTLAGEAINEIRMKVDADNDGIFSEDDPIRSGATWMVH